MINEDRARILSDFRAVFPEHYVLGVTCVGTIISKGISYHDGEGVGNRERMRFNENDVGIFLYNKSTPVNYIYTNVGQTPVVRSTYRSSKCGEGRVPGRRGRGREETCRGYLLRLGNWLSLVSLFSRLGSSLAMHFPEFSTLPSILPSPLLSYIREKKLCARIQRTYCNLFSIRLYWQSKLRPERNANSTYRGAASLLYPLMLSTPSSLSRSISYALNLLPRAVRATQEEKTQADKLSDSIFKGQVRELAKLVSSLTSIKTGQVSLGFNVMANVTLAQ